ncbi:MAG: imm11 family protein [Flammeovirgaceae bacterium]
MILGRIKLDTIKLFYKLFVKPEKCEGCHIFRIKNYHSIIIVSGKIKADFEKNNITGVKFRKV